MRPVKPFIPVNSLYEQRTGSPCLVLLLPIDSIEQLHGNAVVEELVSNFQVRHGSRSAFSLAVRREFHGWPPAAVQFAASLAQSKSRAERDLQSLPGGEKIVNTPLRTIGAKSSLRA
jgi:hypothetical protein